MKQEYIIKNCKSFEPRDIFECGQCFRWNVQEDGSYIGVFGKNVLNVKKNNANVIITGECENDIEKECIQYFDLNRDYEKIKEELSKVDDNLKKSIEYGKGIRILNQDLWEVIISFIISANNNIPRIKGIIERMCKKYGEKITFSGAEYYTFPTPKQLENATITDFRNLGMGFRDKYIYQTTKMINEKIMDLDELKNMKDTVEMRKKLLLLPGVGPKVADCILLFSSLSRLDVFPIDVWVRRVMNDLYIHEEIESNVSKKQIEGIAKEKFGNLEGIAQQYLFYWKREGNN